MNIVTLLFNTQTLKCVFHKVSRGGGGHSFINVLSNGDQYGPISTNVLYKYIPVLYNKRAPNYQKVNGV